MNHKVDGENREGKNIESAEPTTDTEVKKSGRGGPVHVGKVLPVALARIIARIEANQVLRQQGIDMTPEFGDAVAEFQTGADITPKSVRQRQ